MTVKEIRMGQSFPASDARGDLRARAAGRLTAVVRQTEDAAMQIMDGAEALLALADTLDAAAAGRVRQIAISMFEAASFQDLTCQHVCRVMSMLDLVGERLPGPDGVRPVANASTCEGPSCDGGGNDQNAVDRLLGLSG